MKALKYWCKNCQTKTTWQRRPSIISPLYIWACVECQRELLVPGDKPKKPFKTWPCGCYATSPKHIRICGSCGKLSGVEGRRSLWRAHARLRAMAKEVAKEVAGQGKKASKSKSSAAKR